MNIQSSHLHPFAKAARTALLGLLFAFGCGGPGAGYPDKPNVESAQNTWCETLAKVHGGEGGFDRLSDCKDEYPTASAGFLKLMSKCYADRIQAMGDNAPDSQALVDDCTDEIAVKLAFDAASSQELMDARCNRNKRCQKSEEPLDQCKANFMKLESSQRVFLISRFNAAAQHKIADCLGSSSCNEENDDTAVEACYQPMIDKLVWFPL